MYIEKVTPSDLYADLVENVLRESDVTETALEFPQRRGSTLLDHSNIVLLFGHL